VSANRPDQSFSRTAKGRLARRRNTRTRRRDTEGLCRISRHATDARCGAGDRPGPRSVSCRRSAARRASASVSSNDLAVACVLGQRRLGRDTAAESQIVSHRAARVPRPLPSVSLATEPPLPARIRGVWALGGQPHAAGRAGTL